MSDSARRTPTHPELRARHDESSTVRPRDGESEPQARPRQESSTGLRAHAPRSDSGTRPAVAGSLDERLSQKLQLATSLMRDLPPTDARVRLLNVAVMRRDEALLDGVLSELNKKRP